MGVLDQASRYAAQAEPEAIVRRVLRGVGTSLGFRAWVDTRITPRPGQRDRTADRVADLASPEAPERPWLLVFEFQAQHDPDKLDVTLAEAAHLRLDARHGEDRRGKYQILVTLVYLRGSCPEGVLDMTLPGGWGTRHAPLIWNVAEDDAGAALDALEAGVLTWGILFWISLMRGAEDPAVLARWLQHASRIESARVRADLARIALVFAETAGRLIAWSDAMKEWTMIESQLVLEWTADARREAELATLREVLFNLLKRKFPEPLPEEFAGLINGQKSGELLREWFWAGFEAASLAEFLAVLRR
jgi:hypothetical protein